MGECSDMRLLSSGCGVEGGVEAELCEVAWNSSLLSGEVTETKSGAPDKDKSLVKGTSKLVVLVESL